MKTNLQKWYLVSNFNKYSIKQFDMVEKILVLFEYQKNCSTVWFGYHTIKSKPVGLIIFQKSDFLISTTAEFDQQNIHYEIKLPGIIIFDLPNQPICWLNKWLEYLSTDEPILKKQLCLINNIQRINSRLPINEMPQQIKKLKNCQIKLCPFHE